MTHILTGIMTSVCTLVGTFHSVPFEFLAMPHHSEIWMPWICSIKCHLFEIFKLVILAAVRDIDITVLAFIVKIFIRDILGRVFFSERVLYKRLSRGVLNDLSGLDGCIPVTVLWLSRVLSLVKVLSYVSVWTSVEAATESSCYPRHIVAVIFDVSITINKLL